MEIYEICVDYLLRDVISDLFYSKFNLFKYSYYIEIENRLNLIG